MKIKFLTSLLLSCLAVRALALESFTVTGGAIPDGNPVGSSFVGTVSDLPAGSQITGLSVGLNLSGGYNGDLYGYLVAPNGAMVVLVNRPGTDIFGAPGAGFNVTLNDAAATSIQTAPEAAGVQFSGAYQAAGSLSGFNGGNADGDWTLYFADMSNGGGTSTLNGWSLDITAVPEPVNLGLMIFFGIIVAANLWRMCRSSNHPACPK